MTAPRVLHVVECFEGGVGHAVSSYIENAVGVEHYLLYAGSLNPSLLPNVEGTHEFKAKGIARLRELHQYADRVQPDMVHAHSSWAGVYSRVLRLAVPVIYQPHSFIFEAPHLKRLVSIVFKTAERILAQRTARFASLSAREDELMARLAPGVPRSKVVNVAACGDEYSGIWRGDESSRVVMVGRLSKQKDPDFFAEVATRVRAVDPSIEFVWIGDGDVRLKTVLERNSVRVTGWLDPGDVAKVLAGASVYLHTARYEGFPLSVLDAAKVGTPIVVRRLPAFRDLDLNEIDSESGAAEALIALHRRRERLVELAGRSAALSKLMGKASQIESLKELYSATLQHSQAVR